MSPERPDNDSTAIFELMKERFEQLAVPLWHFDGNGSVLSQATVPHVLRPLLSLPAVQSLVESSVAQLVRDNNIGRIRLADGMWVIAAENRRGSQRIAIIAALWLDTRVVCPPEIAALLGEAGRNMWQECARTLPGEVLALPEFEQIFRWTHQDLKRAVDNDRSLAEFSERLTQSYEESKLLFRMARLLNVVSEPRQLVQTIAHQIQQILPFRWIALRFGTMSTGVPDLDGELVLTGELPCNVAEFDLVVSEVLKSIPVDNWTTVLPRNESDLTRLVDSEVLAEPIVHDGKTIGLMLAGNKQGVDPELSSFEMQFLEAAADFLGIFHENIARFTEQRAMFIGTLRAVTASIDAKDPYTHGHSERVALLAAQMAAAMGLSTKEVEQYRIAGLVHDVGKIGVPEAVLCKPGRLTEEEFAQIKLHPGIGYNILREIPALEAVLPGVLLHHERWDGKGYPNKVGGEEIPVIARVLALADTFDAMSSTRSYRPIVPRPKVLEEICTCAGSQFDPSLARMFVLLDFTEFDQALSSVLGLAQCAA